MKRKVKVICIDGIEKTGKSSVATQLWFKYLESHKNINLIKKSDELNLENNNLIIRQKTFLSQLYEDLKNGSNLNDFQEKNNTLINQEKEINRIYGSVYFFIIPELQDFPKHIKKTNEIEYLTKFFKGINQYSLVQGIDIKLIPLKNDERILDIVQKIEETINKEYLLI